MDEFEGDPSEAECDICEGAADFVAEAFIVGDEIHGDVTGFTFRCRPCEELLSHVENDPKSIAQLIVRLESQLKQERSDGDR